LLLRAILVLFLIFYILLWLGVEYDDVKRIFKRENGLGLKDDIFEQCKLESAPLWNLNLKKWLNPDHNPMKICNRSYVPWSNLAPDGIVVLTEAADQKADCRARAILHATEYRHDPKEWHDVEEEFVFENDIVEVECLIANVTVYNFLHYQIWRKDAPKRQQRSVERRPSVHIIVLDSIGASHGRRAFEQTYKYIKKEFGAVEMLHMNKVGENSRPNGVAFLFGKLIERINRKMFGLPSRVGDWNRSIVCNSFLDDRGFILKDFEKKGYKTLMAEDWDKGVFNWPGCLGFKNQPTTHYMRPFQLRMKHGNTKVLRKTMNGMNCFENHLHLNGYHEKFFAAYPDVPTATLTWASDLGHDSPLNPFHADVQFKEFFERNREEFDNSFIFFMGDHGLRFGWYRYDPVGRRDVNNPMLMLSVPKRLRDDPHLMANLQNNSRQLLTLFDTHATLTDIVETFSRDGPPNFNETIEKPYLSGHSLLRPLPDRPRNCKSLPIPPQYCLCEIVRERLNITADHAGIGVAIAAVVNEQLAEANVTDVCSRMEADEVKQLTQIVGANELYEATVKLRPGGGLFQTFVRGSGGDFSVVVPDVTRLNKYGRQGDCTTNNEIRPLCYCKSNLLPTSTPIAKTSPPKATKP
ncbi:hypothetical protein PMAYCL1PPCAC_11577, partial [Pristionchus mayeri]